MCFSTSASRSLSSEATDKASAAARRVRQLSSAPAEAIDQRLQQEHSSLSGSNLAAASAGEIVQEACRVPAGAIVQELQNKLVERGNRSAASAETVTFRPKQLISVPQHKRASAQACFSTSVLEHKRQQKPVERSNRIKASAETVELHPTQWSSGFSTSVSRSLSSEAIN